MYLSPVVRRLKADPTPGAEITLRVTFAENSDADPMLTARKTIVTLNGRVDVELPYRALQVTVPEEAISSLCDIPGITAIETTDVLQPGDAGEDIEIEDNPD